MKTPCVKLSIDVFLSTLSLRRATAQRFTALNNILISIHALLAESDFFDTVQIVIVIVFLSTLSLRRATRETTSVKPIFSISIHALLAESDAETAKTSNADTEFLSTLSLRRATLKPPCVKLSIDVFLSTLSLRRATFGSRFLFNLLVYFYPRSPCGERPQLKPPIEPHRYFYPRSPCGERLFDTVQIVIVVVFLSTLSLRRATGKGQASRARIAISIHALLAESDSKSAQNSGALLRI